MAISINPERIRSGSGQNPKAQQRSQQQESPVVVPARADVNHMPSVESLRTLITSAVSALRRGVFWDRGTIVNLLV